MSAEMKSKTPLFAQKEKEEKKNTGRWAGDSAGGMTHEQGLICRSYPPEKHWTAAEKAGSSRTGTYSFISPLLAE